MSSKHFKIIGLYLMSLICSFLLMSLLWSIFIAGKLYICSDRIPLLEFLPPFVHGKAEDPKSLYDFGDKYIAAKATVYIIWYTYVAGAFAIAFLVTRYLLKQPRVLTSLARKLHVKRKK